MAYLKNFIIWTVVVDHLEEVAASDMRSRGSNPVIAIFMQSFPLAFAISNVSPSVLVSEMTEDFLESKFSDFRRLFSA